MKKIKFIKSIFLIFLFISILCLNIMFFSTDVFASTNLNELDNINNSIDETQNYGTEDGPNIFNNKTIKVCEYIYNLDDSADYIYIEFNEGGYVMLVANSFEIMEYSLQGNLPYTNFENKNYYFGPSNYFRKETDNYINLLTENSIVLAEDKITEYSRNIRNILKINYNENLDENISTYEIFNSISNFDDSESLDLSSPNIDTNNLIIPTLGTGTLIPNYQYFSVNPTHGNNYEGGTYGNENSGTCASVAAQIFLGYNNYYNDRRIIEDRYLNGYDDSTNSIKYPERNPNHCTDPNSMTRYTIGTRSEDTGENSFYSKVITTIMEPNTSGASLDETYEGIIEILNEKLSANDYTIDYELKGWFFGYSPVDSSKIKSEINEGRPVIISLSSNLGAIDHQVVGYGYQNYTYPGSSDTYDGYIVHFGWSGNNCVWVNSSWCKGYISLQMNHTHNYNIVTDNIINNSTIEIRCEECGHRTLDDLFVLSSNTIIETKYDLIGKITIPSNINGIEVKGIGSEAFKNCRNLQEITISNTVTNIDSSAFENCSNLQNVSLPNSLISISTSVFKGCTSLSTITIPNSVQYIDSSAFENCSSLQNVTLPNNLTSISTSVFKGCTSLSTITIPNSVQHIDSSAFENCTSLRSITLPNHITRIGSSAFKGCTSLTSIEIPNSVENIDSNAFENCTSLRSITLPDKVTSIGSSAFKGCTGLTSIDIPNNIRHIDFNAFENCSYLQNVTLSNNLFAIGTAAFKGCSRLTSITIPSSVEYIDSEAFSGCSSLEEVNVLREIIEIINLGEKAFDLCNSSLKIKVPINRLAEYKNKVYWSSYKNKIITTDILDELDLHCTVNNSKNIMIEAKYNKLLKLNVKCGKSYKFTSDSLTKIMIYDSSMTKVYEGENSLSGYLSIGIYYLDIRYYSNDTSGTICLNYSLTWPNNGLEVKYNENTNILSSLHKTCENDYHTKLYFINNKGAGFFKFSLNINSSIPANAIAIYRDKEGINIIDRYSLDGISMPARNNQDEKEMYVSLNKNGYYYIDISLPTNNYNTLTFNVESLEKNNMDYTNSLGIVGFKELFFNQNSINYLEEVTISHRSKIELDISASGSIINNIPIYIFEKKYHAENNQYTIPCKLDELITPTNSKPVFSIVLDEGTYYIGYLDNVDKINISFALVRRVNTDVDMNNTLVTDPAENEGYELGSEVTFNNGQCGGNTIAEGFTRSIYLMVEDRLLQPMSRLDYDWYSSNENVATVTQYGTVLAHQVIENSEVIIYAVLKEDPSIVYKKTFTILKDTNQEVLEIKCNMNYSYSKQNGEYKLQLNSDNCPYPMIQEYIWQITPVDDITVSMNYWGQVTSSGTGVAIITGTYILNPRVKVVITLTINE